MKGRTLVSVAAVLTLFSACAAERVLLITFDSGSAEEFVALASVRDLKASGAFREKVRGVLPFDRRETNEQAILRVTGPECHAVSPTLAEVLEKSGKRGHLKTVRLAKMADDALKAALERNMTEGTLVIVTATRTNGPDRPLVMAGPGVKKGFVITETTALYDVGATVAFALDVKFPQVWTGRPILSAFEGHESTDDNIIPKQGTPRAKRIVFIGMDGLSAGVFGSPTSAPFMKKLMKEGAWTMKMRSMLPTSSCCNWATTFLGAGPEMTGFDDSDTPMPSYAPACQLKQNLRFPDFFHRIRRCGRLSSMYTFNWGGVARVIDPGVVNFTYFGEGYNPRDTVVKDTLERYKPEVFCIIFNQPDAAGHRFGWDTPKYEACINELDGRVVQIFDSLRLIGSLDDVVVIISGDHGGLNRLHGGTDPREQLHPFIVWGKGVKRGFEIADVTTNADIPATMLWLADIPLPQSWRGRPVLSAFDCK